jgi:hypothetical protein
VILADKWNQLKSYKEIRFKSTELIVKRLTILKEKAERIIK